MYTGFSPLSDISLILEMVNRKSKSLCRSLSTFSFYKTKYINSKVRSQGGTMNQQN